MGETVLRTGDRLDTAIMDNYVLENCLPVYVELPGWEDLSDPEQALSQLIDLVEQYVDITVDVISIGADRDETIVL